MRRKRADLKLIGVNDKKKIKVFASQSYLIFQRITYFNSKILS